MKRLAVAALVMAGILCWGGRSFAVTILDNYIGADPTGNYSQWETADVIGSADEFDISKMEVNVVGGKLVVDIYSSYFDNVGSPSSNPTQLGDLFISTDGWHPYGDTTGDKYGTGEDWEFVIALDDHLGSSGTANLYQLTGDGTDIQLSYLEHTDGWIFREEQEVQYKAPADPLALTSGEWEISADQEFLRITIEAAGKGFDFSDLSSLGFHWGMTCANDVIEGAAPVPEPSTMLLLGVGLLGMAGLGRKRMGMRHSR